MIGVWGSVIRDLGFEDSGSLGLWGFRFCGHGYLGLWVQVYFLGVRF